MKEKVVVKSKASIAVIFFLILCFVFVMFPLFGQNWSFVTGSSISILTVQIGTVLVTIGGIMFALGILSLCMHSFKSGIVLMLMDT